jgi:hypothetical protein
VAKAYFDFVAFMSGMNPRPTARRSFSAARKARRFQLEPIAGDKSPAYGPGEFFGML